MTADGLTPEPTLERPEPETEWAAGQQRLLDKAETLAANWEACAQQMRDEYVASVGPAAAMLASGHVEASLLAKCASDLRTVLEAGATFAAQGADGMTEYTCHACGAQFRSNCSAGDIECTNCEARLCSYCGEWDQELIY